MPTNIKRHLTASSPLPAPAPVPPIGAEIGKIWGENGDWFELTAKGVKRICGAKRRGRGETRCRVGVVMENGRCRLHGGATPKGIFSASWKHGRYSDTVQGDLARRYARAQSDPASLALLDEIYLLDARLGELLTRVNTGESGAGWKKAAETLKAYKLELDKARRHQEGADPETALAAHADAIEGGLLDYAAWAEIGTQIDRRMRLVETQKKFDQTAENVITRDKAMELLMTFAGIALKYVPIDFRAAYQRDVGAIINPRISGTVDSTATVP